MNILDIRRNLLEWGRLHFQTYPWRLSDDPYRLLVAELFLHRTQARQVANVYPIFIVKFFDIFSLANTSKQEIELAMFSVGLRWRASLIQSMAVEIVEKFDGRIPQEKDYLLSLPGVGDYIASAVRCFAWNFPDTLVDTNTIRVVGRLNNTETSDSTRRDASFRKLITELVDVEKPREFNYSLLDLAGLVCTKKRPKHKECPLQELCLFNVAEAGSS